LQYHAVVLQKLLTITEKRMALKAKKSYQLQYDLHDLSQITPVQMAHGQVMRVKSHFPGTYDL
jgi:hypothetical protein